MTMTASRIARGLGLAAFALASFSTVAAADSLFGGRVGLYTHRDQPYFGVEAVVPLGGGFAANPNVEYVRYGDTQELSFNADVQREFRVKGRVLAWAGAGLGLVSIHPDGPGEDDSKDGLANLFLGVGMETGIGMPYLTAKYVTKRNPQFLLGLGMRF
jgi:hypothetical protein